MACHLAGVPTAVATCGTAFGDEHARGAAALPARPRGVPRRGDLHLRRRRRRPEGRAARLRGRPELRLPDLRRRRADRAGPVRPAHPAGRRRRARAGRPAGAALPLRARNVVGQVRPRPRRRPGRRASARPPGWCPSIRDKSKVDAFSRELAGHGRRRHRAGARGGTPRRRPVAHRPRARRAPAAESPSSRSRHRSSSCPTCATRGSPLERETLKLVLQHPAAVGRAASDVGANDFHPPDLPRPLGAGRRAAGGPAAARRRLGRPAPRRPPTTPSSSSASQRPRGRAAAHRQGAGPRLRRRPRLPAAGAHRDAADRRGEVAAPAHQPGRGVRRLQQDVRRAGRARAAPTQRCASWRWASA